MEAFTPIQREADALSCCATWFCILMGKLVFPLVTNGAWNFTGFNRVTLRGQQCLAELQEKKANKLWTEKNLAGKVGRYLLVGSLVLSRLFLCTSTPVCSLTGICKPGTCPELRFG